MLASDYIIILQLTTGPTEQQVWNQNKQGMQTESGFYFFI